MEQKIQKIPEMPPEIYNKMILQHLCPKHLCLDLDEDCESVVDKITCQMLSPKQGICPYLNGNPEFNIIHT